MINYLLDQIIDFHFSDVYPLIVEIDGVPYFPLDEFLPSVVGFISFCFILGMLSATLFFPLAERFIDFLILSFKKVAGISSGEDGES